MHIGLIGGIGPAATIAYYNKLIAAFKASDTPLKLTIAHADINTLAPNAAADRKDEQAAVFANHLHQLKNAGCDLALITSLTGHFCFEKTKALSPLELISGTALIDAHCEKEGIKSLGLLGSPPVLKTHIFGMVKGPKTIVLEDRIQEIGETYMELAQTGMCTQTQRTLMFDAGAELIEQGAEAVLLAGTDLGLAYDGHTTDYRVVDALDVHVNALLTMAL